MIPRVGTVWNGHESNPQANVSQDPFYAGSPHCIQLSLEDVCDRKDFRYVPMGVPAAVLSGLGALPTGREMQSNKRLLFNS